MGVPAMVTETPASAFPVNALVTVPDTSKSGISACAEGISPHAETKSKKNKKIAIPVVVKSFLGFIDCIFL